MKKSEISISRLSSVLELFEFFWRTKQWWLLPLAGCLLVLGLLMGVAQSSAVGPLMYTIF